MSIAKVKSITQNASNKLYTVGGKHIAGQHSLTTGEIVCFAIAACMILAPQLWAKIPFAGKFGSATIALVILFIALVIW